MDNAFSLIKPFTASVGSNGTAVVTVTHSLQGLSWTIYQIGFALGQQASSPQVAAHLNGQPLVSSAPMQLSAFASIPGQSPYAMEIFYVGPPYVVLESGDQLVCAVIGATPGDVFTAAAYISEGQSQSVLNAQRAQYQTIPRWW